MNIIGKIGALLVVEAPVHVGWATTIWGYPELCLVGRERRPLCVMPALISDHWLARYVALYDALGEGPWPRVAATEKECVGVDCGIGFNFRHILAAAGPQGMAFEATPVIAHVLARTICAVRRVGAVVSTDLAMFRIDARGNVLCEGMEPSPPHPIKAPKGAWLLELAGVDEESEDPLVQAILGAQWEAVAAMTTDLDDSRARLSEMVRAVLGDQCRLVDDWCEELLAIDFDAALGAAAEFRLPPLHGRWRPGS